MDIFQHFIAKIIVQFSKMRKGCLSNPEAKIMILFGDYHMYPLDSKKLWALLFGGIFHISCSFCFPQMPGAFYSVAQRYLFYSGNCKKRKKEDCPWNHKYMYMNTIDNSSFCLHREGNNVKKYPRISYNCCSQNG